MKHDQAKITVLRGILARTLGTALLLLVSHPALGADVKATWQPVNKDVSGADDSISHYLLYLGRTPRPAEVSHPGDGTFSYEKVLNAGRSTRHLVTGVEPGTWFFSVSAVDMDGKLSEYSDEVKIELPDKDGKVPPPRPMAKKSSKAPKIKNPDTGCSTAEPPASISLLLLLSSMALVRARKTV